MIDARGPRRGIPLRAVAPNAVTALALCFGLSGVRFGISAAGGVSGDWEKAIGCIIVAGVLDGLDGRIARMLKGESRFGAELDSLSDVIAFGVSPAVIIYLWSLQHMPQFGWTISLAHAVCCALRLARFNANIDVKDQPHKSAGFLTGIPAPTGAGLLFLPVYLWLWTGLAFFREPLVVAPWAALVAFLMVSNVATYSWSALRIRRGVRLGMLAAVALLGASLISAPWATLTVVSIAYLASVPFGILAYAKVRRQRAAAAVPDAPAAA
ncbi:phosphatidylcholine/phosphatidylserine synthase [Sphingomonas sp. 1P06PA]|uniref:CDP-alcohol phosphatidyltransferase family protein n=1 Tax=Sphingomonas sp. 1P06PA TaxID=554121 RepID=UPI0039A60A80